MIRKIIDITPVGRYRFARGMGFDIMPDKCLFAGAGRPQGEQVEAILLDADAKVDCFLSPWLTYCFRQVFQFIGRLELEFFSITAAIKRFGL